MPKLIDLTGQTFNRLTVIHRTENDKSGNACWECQCVCGNITIVPTGSLKSGHTKSCGCFMKESHAKRKFIHGMSDTSEYSVWEGIIQRCTNPNNQAFKDYGGRNIGVCSKWKNDFMAFFNDMGKKPSPKLTIERVDNNKGYFPENCVWASRKNQSNNRRNNWAITFNGITLNITQWAEKVGIDREILRARVDKLKWSIEDALYTPKNKYPRGKYYITINGWTMSISQWAHFVNRPANTVFGRLKRGWPPAKAIFTPIQRKRTRK